MRSVPPCRSLFGNTGVTRNVTSLTCKKVVVIKHLESVRRHVRRRAICVVLILSLFCLPGSHYAYAQIPELTGGLVRLSTMPYIFKRLFSRSIRRHQDTSQIGLLQTSLSTPHGLLTANAGPCLLTGAL